MQYRIYDRRKIAYIDGGAVRSYTINSDYINNNNSTVDIIKPTSANVGDIICLIKDSGAYDKGVVTSVDNEALQISYKSDKELFNDNIINPLASEFKEDTDLDFTYTFGVERIKEMIELYWGRSTDPYRRLPLKVVTDGDVLGEFLVWDDKNNAVMGDDGKQKTEIRPKMVWTWTDISIQFVDWLIELFKSYSVVLKWDIDFNTAETVLSARQPNYIVTISAVNNNSEMIRDNVAMQTITYTKEELPEKTVCIVIDANTKQIATTDDNAKNLFDKFFGYEDSYIDPQNGTCYNVIREKFSQNSNVSKYIRVEPNTAYTLSMANSDSTNRAIALYDKDKTCIGIVQEQNGKWVIVKPANHLEAWYVYNTPITFTTTSDTAYVRFCFDKNATQVQFEEGSEATGYDENIHKAIYYLCARETTAEKGDITEITGVEYYVTPDQNDPNRLLPVRTKYIEYDATEQGSRNSDLTVTEAAKNELTPNDFNQAIEIEIPRDSKMFDFELANFGDVYKIITKNGRIKVVDGKEIAQNFTYTSVYSGRKESSDSNMVTLLFGLGRKNYTDLIQGKMRSERYSSIYRR